MVEKDSKNTGGDTLVDRIEADIVSGHFRPGEWLKQADVEETYQANRFDVRMALNELKSLKLIEHVRNRGFRVINLTAVEREQLLETRIILERAAAKLAVERASNEEVEILADIADRFAAILENGPYDELRTLNSMFHDQLYGACGNSLLTDEIGALRRRGIPGSREGAALWGTVGGLNRSHDEHVEMVRLLRARDGDGLADMIEHHISHWRELFSSRPGDQGGNAAAARSKVGQLGQVQ